MSFIVAIDGPSGAGKGTITSKIAKIFNLMYLDTGATYRCVTLKFLNEKIKFDNPENIKNNNEKIEEILKNIKIEFKDDSKVFLDEKDVTKEIREPKVAKNVSQVSHILAVRLAMVDLQRKMSEGKNVILEGRDIGTNVFPNANVKIFLDASLEARVKRRVKQNKEKNINMTEDEVRKNLSFRDENDKNSDVGPLKQAEDAIYVDTTNLSVNQAIHKISKIIKKEKRNDKRIAKGYIMTKETIFKKIERKVVKGILASFYHITFRVKKVGDKNLQLDEGYIICANHLNYFDALGIVVLNHRYIRFVGKSDLYRIPVISWLGHLFNVIPVKRNSSDMTSIKMCLKALKSKEALGIFPEGTRKGMEKHTKVKNGATFLAYKANVKIIPVGIQGNFKPFTKVVFNYGEPIDITTFKTDDPNWLDNATTEVMNKIIMLTKQKV